LITGAHSLKPIDLKPFARRTITLSHQNITYGQAGSTGRLTDEHIPARGSTNLRADQYPSRISID